MELKFKNKGLISAEILSFNRTFMELKCVHTCIYAYTLCVLIVPLWN